MRRVVFAVCAALKAAQDHLTDLDRVVGDGDIGISLARGAAAIESEFAGYDTSSAAAILRGISATVRRAVGGTSGPLYAVFLLRGAAALEKQGTSDVAAWASAFKEGCQGISELGGAAEGDRTMLDALIPAAQALAELHRRADARRAAATDGSGRRERSGQDRPDDAAARALKLHGRSRGRACRSRRRSRRDLADRLAEGDRLITHSHQAWLCFFSRNASATNITPRTTE